MQVNDLKRSIDQAELGHWFQTHDEPVAGYPDEISGSHMQELTEFMSVEYTLLGSVVTSLPDLDAIMSMTPVPNLACRMTVNGSVVYAYIFPQSTREQAELHRVLRESYPEAYALLSN